MVLHSVLILAGRRGGALDPLAEKAGVSHKCLVPVLGVPLIERTLRIVAEAFPEAPLFISIEDEAVIRELPLVSELMTKGRLTLLQAETNLVDSVLKAVEATGLPLLITTGDNVLMTVEAVRRVPVEARLRGADALASMTRKESILAAHPEGEIFFFRFKDGEYSNCNMFWLANDKALGALRFFAEGGQFAKRPERILKAFGLLNLIRYRFRLHSLAGMMAHLSRRFGFKMQVLVMPEGRLAIDVDDERTKRVAEELLARDAR